MSISHAILIAASLTAQPVSTKIGLTSERTDYSGAYGRREETGLETKFDVGKTAIVLWATRGKRKFEAESFKGVQAAGALYHDWSDRISSRSSVSLADKSPVFARTEIAQDVSYKLTPNALVMVGGKYARYFGGTDVHSLFGGGSLYFRGGVASYRFGVHGVENRGTQYSHLGSVRLKDMRGSGLTQLWLAAGTALQEQGILAAGREGKYRGVHLQRFQPVAGPVAMSFGLGRTWYDTPVGDYRGTKATLGFTLSR